MKILDILCNYICLLKSRFWVYFISKPSIFASKANYAKCLLTFWLMLPSLLMGGMITDKKAALAGKHSSQDSQASQVNEKLYTLRKKLESCYSRVKTLDQEESFKNLLV